MASAAKLTVKKKSLKPPPVAASSQSIERPDGTRERIMKKAFELWQERGYRDGHDLQDWLDAEAIVMGAIHETRK